MKLQLPKASSGVILTVFIQDSSSSTGAGLGGLDQTSSITGGYVKRNGTGVALAVDQNVDTEGTYEAPSTAAQVRIGTPANLPAGFYELHFHNDLFTMADWVTMGFAGASNMAPLTLEIQLTSVDLNDAVRGGMTALPDAAAEAPGGVYTRGTGAGQIKQITDGVIDANAVSAVAAFFEDCFTVDSGKVSGNEVSGSLILEIVKVAWDRVLTGSSHNIATSAGRRLRQVEAAFVHASGVIATVTNGHTITLDAGAVATAGYYLGDRLEIIEGTGIGQSRLIAAYTSGRVCTLDSDFAISPNTASLYNVVAADVHVSLSDADLAGGFVATYTNTTTITLDSAAVATANFYRDMVIVFTHGTGKGQSRQITAYTSGRVCTLSPALTTALDATTGWHITANAGMENLNTVVPPSVSQFNARTLLAAAYFDPSTDAVTTDAASRTASKATGFAVAGDEMAMSAAERNAVADALLLRNVSNVEAAAGDHSLCYVVLAMSESDTTSNANKLTVFKTNGTSEFVQKTITTDAAADPLTKVE